MSGETKPAVLVVEDERVVAWDLREMVNGFGLDCYAIAASAEEAMRAAEAKRPDVVLMDIRLKGPVDGIEAARMLQEKYGPQLRVVFISAHSQSAMGPRAESVPGAVWLRKPIRAPMLRKTLGQLLGIPDPAG